MTDPDELRIACACAPAEPFNAAAWWRVGVGLLIAANSLTLSLAVNTSETSAAEERTLHLVLLGLALASLAILGWPLARNAARALAERRITIEAMFLAGLTGAMAASLVAVATGTGDVYFEIVVILVVVYSFGQQLTSQVQERALRSAVAWSPETTRCTVIDPDGRVSDIPVAELAAGQLVLVQPGMAIAADGVVRAGEAFVREAEMTGEPFSVVKRPGDRVWAGTVCVDAGLTVEATADGGHRRIDRILDAVDRARGVPSTLQAQADRLVARFLPVVVTVAAVTFGGWLVLAGWEVALFNAMAVLLVACPCALGLATPLAVWEAIGRLASRGLVVRGGEAVEVLAAVDLAVFDKTGTITEAESSLVDLVVEPPPGLEGDDVVDLLRSVERASRHPVAAAFAGLEPRPDCRWSVETLEVVPATGVRASVVDRAGGRRRVVVVGDAERLAESVGDRRFELADRLRGSVGALRIAVLVDGTPAAAALVDERLRSSWADALAGLRDLHVETVVMTGDRAERAELTAADHVLAELTPEAKLVEVHRLKERGRIVLYVGDGVNDAAAMAASHVGVGVATGTDLAVEVAAVTWHGHDLRAIPWAVQAARRTVSVIRSNLLLAAAYNLVGVSLAACGVLHPVAASLLMMCSSVIVTWRAIGGLAEHERREVDAATGGGRALHAQTHEEGVAA